MPSTNDTTSQEQRGTQPQGSPRRELSIEQRRQMRHESRVSQTYAKFLKRIEENGLSREQAEKAAVAVLCTLEQRLIGNEPAHLEAQLPMKLKELLQRCKLHAKGQGMRKLDRPEFFQKVSEHLSDESLDSEIAVRAVFGALRDHISAGEVDDVVGQLPAELAALWIPVV